jgi:hypothetical protein
MAELNRLLDELVLAGVVPGQVEQADRAAKDGCEPDRRQNAEPGVDVGVAVEDLTHCVDVSAKFPKSLLETAVFAEAQRAAAHPRVTIGPGPGTAIPIM